MRQEFGANESTYWVIFELIWRDYFKYISLKYGNSNSFSTWWNFRERLFNGAAEQTINYINGLTEKQKTIL